ncbi:hypothetical protein WN51_14189 [Melipona quadrifasciata]|uniref:Odorant receptor Or2 n=1 Tax=Melipona quadrifasciata TaxID=166423 RepID=A0A0M9A1V8_9HYME|nr:hypothetical protein WN51_14189 [Melipona quadrifasciata]
MGRRIAPERAILFTKLSVALTCSWPPSPLATKTQLFLFNALWCTAFVSSIALFLPLMAAIYEYRKHPIVLGKTVSLASAVVQVAIKMMICRLQQKRFQLLCFEMENFCKRATKTERMVLERYVEKYKYSHGIYILWCFLTTVFVICGPLYSSQTFPTHAIYPFSVKHQPLKSLIFFHQSLVGFQASSGMGIDIQVALLLRYATARFELLGMQLHNVRSNSEIDACIKKHIELLRYAEEVVSCFRFVVLYTIAVTTFAMILCGVIMIMDAPLIVKVQFITICVTVLTEVYMYAWPVDHMKEMSLKVSQSVYDLPWYEHTAMMQKNLLNVLVYQKPVILSIKCLVPELSLRFYCSHVVDELMTYVKQAQQYERDIFCTYIDKCNRFYGGYIAVVYTTLIVFLLGPLVVPVPFPLDAEYPFSVNYTPVYVILYFHQAFTCFQCAGHTSISLFAALLLFFTVARFECLAMEFEKSRNIDMLIVCIKKQLYLRRYAEDVISCFRFIVFYAIIVSTCGLTFCGIIFLMNLSMTVKMQFVTICMTGLVEMYLFAWPADHIKDMSERISRSGYNGKWYEATLEMQKCLLNVLVFQEPVIFSINCVVPEFSLPYYCSSLNVLRSTYNIKWYDHSLEMQKQILTILGYKKPITLSIACFMPELTLRFFCSNTPLIVKVAFTGLSAALLMYIYMYAWPADCMKEKSLSVSRSVYDITWYEETVGMQKDLLNILVYQKPVTLSITCLVPELSLSYYCTVGRL